MKGPSAFTVPCLELYWHLFKVLGENQTQMKIQFIAQRPFHKIMEQIFQNTVLLYFSLQK